MSREREDIGTEENINSTKIPAKLSWAAKRLIVYDKCNGICDVCREPVPIEYYECGHIVDRCCGGSDDLDNLVCMCNFCNRVLKPLHETKEDYEAWKRTNPSKAFWREAYRRATDEQTTL